MHPSRKLAGPVLALVLAAVVGPVAAAPASATSALSGCTLIGTQGPDHLVGTSHRDVICGAGGNDVIRGGGGNDEVRGGSGRDWIMGGTGADTLIGNDGDDTLQGGDGNDHLIGVDGNDTELGDGGSDLVSGGLGNDDLTGGTGTDDIRGGDGTNWCTVDAVDVSTRCVYDKTPAKADSVSVSASSVDVTLAPRTVTFRVHVTDDTGAQTVNVINGPDPQEFSTGFGKLVSGTVRNGWWDVTVSFPRYRLPGTFVATVVTGDRIGRKASFDFPSVTVGVRDDTPDLELPEVTLLSPTPDATYDARTKWVSFPVKAHITDDASGVYEDVSISAWSPRGSGAYHGTGGGMHLVSGTNRDGVWQGNVILDAGEVGGDWTLEISVRDNSHGWSGLRHWWGAAEMEYQDPQQSRVFTDGMGSFHLLGVAHTDVTPPTVSDARVSPGTVDTLPGPAQVSVAVDAADAGVGLRDFFAVRVELVPAVEDPDLDLSVETALSLSTGTFAHGTWAGTLTLPQGLPPGDYYLRVWAWDADGNGATYVSSGMSGASDWWDVIPSNPVVTVVDAGP